MEIELKDKNPREIIDEQPKKSPMKNVVFDLRWHDAIQKLPEYERLEMYEAICRYAADGTEYETMECFKQMALLMIFDRIDDQRRSLDENPT